MNTMPTYSRSYILSHSQRLMNDAIKQIGGFCNNSNYYTDTYSPYVQKKCWSDLLDNGFVGRTLGWVKMITKIRVYFMLGS